jgi:DinB superfamily
MTRQILNRQLLTNLLICYTLSLTVIVQAQETKSLWTEADRQYTLDNMRRTRDELVKETENLTPAQWAFRDSAHRWSIAQVVEHLALWEIIWAREIGMGCRSKPQPELNATSRPDSYYSDFIMEDKQHTASDFSVPTGFMTGKDNLTFFLRGRDQAIKFVETTKFDMRAQFELVNTPNPRNMHQVLIYQWGHVDRHLKQIRKLKAHKNYPKSNDIDRTSDEKAIMATIQRETDCFYARDYNGWKETYVQEKYTHQGWSNQDGTFDIKVGWDKVNASIEKYIKENILPSKEKRRVERKDIQYTFYGDNVCYLTWEQYQIYSAEKAFHHSHEIRVMEKRNGQWKIASQSAFWDYKNLTPITEYKP